jgi:hypothetical protein
MPPAPTTISGQKSGSVRAPQQLRDRRNLLLHKELHRIVLLSAARRLDHASRRAQDLVGRSQSDGDQARIRLVHQVGDEPLEHDRVAGGVRGFRPPPPAS